MIAIALDEGGHFEIDRNDTRVPCMMIGGCVFRYEQPKQIKGETDRLRKLFMTVCDEQEANYPYDLHYNHEGGTVVNADAANRVKNALFAELPGFFSGSEKWGKPNGDYILYAMVGDRKGMEQGYVGNLADDDKASMRYEHMVYRTVENLLFYDPYLEGEKDIRLDLATRVMKVSESDARYADVQQLGYDRRLQSDGKRDDKTRIVTNAESFRTALNYAVQNSGVKDINFDLKVQSINYRNEVREQMFLYLADTLCSFYQETVGSISTARLAMDKLKTACDEMMRCKGRCYLWEYSQKDEEYRAICNAIRYNNDFEALCGIYTKKQQKDETTTIYNEIWYRPLLRKIEKKSDAARLRYSLSRLNEYLRSGECNLLVAKDILDSLTKQQQNIPKNQRSDDLLFELYKTRMTIHNHLGDFESAMQDQALCVSVAQYTTVEEYIGLQTVLCVALLDAEKIDEATRIAEEAVEYQEMLTDIKKAISPSQKGVFISLGRTLSQLGQCYALQGFYEEAEESFRRSISLYGESVGDIQITTSYLLHLLIEMESKEKYEETAAIYFGSGDKMKQWEAINAMNPRSRAFALYVYIKALYTFYLTEMTKKNMNTILKGTVNLFETTADGHPWELIMKYCALIHAKINAPQGDETSAQYMEMARKAVQEKTGKLPAIVAFGEKEYAAAIQGETLPGDEVIRYYFR